VEFMEHNEIAAVMISLSMPVMDGTELIELFLNKNKRLQIMLLFDEADTERVVQMHNNYHLCKIFCKNIFALDELPRHIEDALFSYNKDEELKKIELSYKEKEEKYKKTMFEMSTLLNDRMESYQEVIRHFMILSRYLLENTYTVDSSNYIGDILNSQKQILQNFVQIYLLRTPKQDGYFETAGVRSNHPEIKKYFKVFNEVRTVIDDEIFQNMAFLLGTIMTYFTYYYSEYRGKAIVTKNEQFYLLNIVYEVKQSEKMKKAGLELFALNERIVSSYAFKAAYGSRDAVMQFKIYFAGPEMKEA